MRFIWHKRAEISTFGTSVPYPLRGESPCCIRLLDQTKRLDVQQANPRSELPVQSEGQGFKHMEAYRLLFEHVDKIDERRARSMARKRMCHRLQ